ncbi:MAG TPA: hypothetical protein VLF94_06810, partial [Chlamydiales bacterium]|nr:hypothetical protein [Chlamydiales bacterium]
EMCRLIGHMQKVARIAVTRGLRVVVRSAEDEVQAWRTQMGRIQEDLRHIEEEQARKAYMDDLCIYDGAAADSMAKLEAIRGLAPDDLLGVGSSPLRQEVPSP